jgi:Resolvase, N terminal domain/TIR domain
LSRKYAYQVLLAEELARCGVELIFLRAPSGATAEDQLLVQFRGMIAEYERAQIAERSRRGKRHRAQQGSINVLSGAPYGYRHVKKTDTSAAYYEVVESEAEVVRFIFDAYTRQGLSLVPSRACSTNARCRRERDRADGNAPPSGGCCTTRLARGVPSMVRDLFHRLRQDGFDPWLDEEALLPRQDWQEEIPKAIRACDAVVVCLSGIQ